MCGCVLTFMSCLLRKVSTAQQQRAYSFRCWMACCSVSCDFRCCAMMAWHCLLLMLRTLYVDHRPSLQQQLRSDHPAEFNLMQEVALSAPQHQRARNLRVDTAATIVLPELMLRHICSRNVAPVPQTNAPASCSSDAGLR